MSLTLLLAVTAAAAATAGYFAAKKAGGGRAEERREEGDEAAPAQRKSGSGADREDEAKRKEKPVKAKAKVNVKVDPAPFATLPLALGDVVSNGSDERWLAGAIVAREGDRVIAALFLAPEGKENKAVAAFAPPRKDVWWMSPVEVESPGEPPATIEVAGVAMARKARLPVRLSKLGQGAAPIGDEGVWAVYDHGRDVAVVIASGGSVISFAGVRLDEDEYDRLGGAGEE